jgi:hypothetical protein
LAAVSSIPPEFRILGWEEIIAPQDAVPWLNQGLTIAPGRPIVPCGEPGTLKSWWKQALCVSAAADIDFLGKFPWRKGGARCLYVDYEQGEPESRRRFDLLGKGMGVKGLGARCSFVYQPIESLGLQNKKAFDQLCRLVDGYDLVATDSLIECQPGVDENSPQAADPLRLMARVSEKIGVTFVVADHSTTKPAQGASRGAAQRGHSSKKGASSVLYVFTGTKGEVTVTCERSQNAPVSAWHAPYAWNLMSTLGGGVLPVLVQMPEAVRPSKDIADAVLDCVKANPERSTGWIRKRLHAAEEAVKAQLLSYASAGLVRNLGTDGKSSWIHVGKQYPKRTGPDGS